MDYGERGHFYRILAGPLHSADAANDLCRRLREDNPQEFCKVLTR
jgi:cell division septation protein DedD